MSSDYLQQVRSQYEQYPYPPRDPAHERERLVETQGDFLDVVNFYCYEGRRDFAPGFRALVAGCGTGDAAVFLAEQLLETGGEVVALDFSESSLQIARARSEARRLPNIRYVRAALQDLPSLAVGEFDYINCTGVLHHLADPDMGLRTLARVLKQGGAIHLMVYGAYGRAPIYPIQQLLRRIAGPDLRAGERIRLAKKLIEQLPASNPFKKEYARLAHDIVQFGDAGLFDLLLHAQDRPYTVAQLYALVENAGLRLVAPDSYGGGGKTCYSPASYLKDPELLALVADRPLPERHAIAELLAGDMSTHACYVTQRAVDPPLFEERSAIPFIPAAWAEADAHLALHREMLQKLGEPMSVAFRGSGLGISFRASAAAARILRYLDGERSTEEICALAQADAGSVPGAAKVTGEVLLAEFAALYRAFNALDWMLLRRPGSRAMRSGAQLQRRMLQRT